MEFLTFAGVDDGSFFQRNDRDRASLLCSVLLVRSRIRDVRVGQIQVDGDDSTEEILRLVEAWRFRALFLSGITFGGFNVVDGRRLYERLRKPIIVVPSRKPGSRNMLSALRKHFPDWARRWGLVRAAGPLYTARSFPGEPKLHFEMFGSSLKEARRFLRLTALCSRVPEPIRAVRMIARAFSAQDVRELP